MEFDYTPKGVCSRNIHVEVEDGLLKMFNLLVDVLEIRKVWQPYVKE